MAGIAPFNPTRLPTPDQDAALDAANAPTALNPLATIADLISSPGTVKVSGADTLARYLSEKLTASPASVTWTIVNPGGDEDLRITIGNGTTGGPGLIELATQAEVDGGADATRAVTPATLAAAATVLKSADIGSTVQAWDADLDGVAALAVTGLAVRTGAGTWTTRALTEPAAGLTITNPAGLAGSPTFALANDLAALEGLGSTGLAVRSAADTWVQRSIVPANSSVTVVDGDGVAGNPTLDVAPASTVLAGKAEIATQAEVDAGTDAVRIVTPATLAARQVVRRAVSSSDGIDVEDEYLFVDTSGGALTLTLPTPSTMNHPVTIKDVGGASETNAITLARAASEEIEGVAASRELRANFGTWTVISDDTDWWIV